MNRKTIIAKTIQVGSSTLLSRLLGLVREVLMANYLGAGILGEAFITAYKIPNSLRKIFAEGALSVAFIPTFVQLRAQNGVERVNRLLTLSLVLFQGFLIVFCLFCIIKSHLIIRIIMPGWFSGGGHQIPQFPWNAITFGTFLKTITDYFSSMNIGLTASPQVPYAETFLRILMGFIVLLSTSSLIAGVLQAEHRFLIPSISPILLNIFFIVGIVIGLKWNTSPVLLCWCIMIGGFVTLLIHIAAYYKLGFKIESPNATTWKDFGKVMGKFLPCLIAMSIMEIYLFIDTSLGSYLPTGSVALIYYANRFMQIPLGVIATALATILLPYFTRIGTYAPKRLGKYLFEATKVVVWTLVPITLLMGFVSHQIFHTLFLSSKFTAAHVQEASTILIACLYGVVFFSLNKILLNIYYGLNSTIIPMIISIICVVINGFASYILMQSWGAYGIALGTTISGIAQTLFSLFFLYYYFNFSFYGIPFLFFLIRLFAQLLVIGIGFVLLYCGIAVLISLFPLWLAQFLLLKMGFWLWYIPLSCLAFFFLFKTRNWFGLKMYFID